MPVTPASTSTVCGPAVVCWWAQLFAPSPEDACDLPPDNRSPLKPGAGGIAPVAG